MGKCSYGMDEHEQTISIYLYVYLSVYQFRTVMGKCSYGMDEHEQTIQLDNSTTVKVKTMFSIIASKPIDICSIRTGSQPY